MIPVEDPLDPREDSDADIKEKKTLSKKTGTLCTFAIASIVLQIVSIINALINGGSMYFLIFLASGIGLIVGAVVLLRQFFVMENLDTLHDVQNQLTSIMNKLRGENNVLTGNVDELTNQNDRIEENEKALSAVAKQQGQNVDQVLKAFKENKEVQNKMERVIHQKLIQSFYQVVIRSDTNGDMHIDEKELDILALRISNILGISIHTELFIEKAQEFGGSLDKIFDYIQIVLKGEATDEVPIIEVDTKQVKEDMC